jgi:hypothetical protein
LRNAVRGKSRNLPTVKKNSAVIGQQVTRQQIDEGRFTSAVRAYDSMHLTALELERDIVCRSQAAEILA